MKITLNDILRTARITFFVGHGKQHRCHKKACGKCEPRIFFGIFYLKGGYLNHVDG